MMPIILILIAVLLIYFGTKRLKKTRSDNEEKNSASSNSTNSDATNKKFQSQIGNLQFPDRIAAIDWHIIAINKGLANGELDFTNLSYAKLIESIRQQNENESGAFEDFLYAIRTEYDEFRKLHELQYPKHFLPPSERKKTASSQDFSAKENSIVFLETLNFNQIPKSVIKHIDVVRTVSQWNELGFKPKKDEYGRWSDIKRQERYFEFVEASNTNPKHKLSLETGRKITSKPYYIKRLIEQGILLSEFVESGDDLKHFINADNLFEEEKYEDALREIDLAISIRETMDYKELKTDIQVKLNNSDIVRQQFKKYEIDIDSPIHTKEIYDWFSALIKNKEYSKVIGYLQNTNETLDKLSKGLITSKIYTQQSGDWYLHKKEDFNKNLFRMLTIKATEIEKTEDSIKMLEHLMYLYIGKDIKGIESIADIYAHWKLNDRAIGLYTLCLDKTVDEEKPKVKARLAKKIEQLKN
jgi:hypothetical protein